jgi:hypothetical protein
MTKLFRSLLALTAVLGVAAVSVHFLRAEPPATPAAAATPEIAPAPHAAKELIPVRITDVRAETKFAVKPKELSAAVKKGLEYLVKNQQEDGGWNQGGGWRIGNNNNGQRIEGANVEDPSDIGNTSLALLTLIRTGSTTTEGEYKDAVKKGLKFVLTRLEKADKDSLYVTDVRGTQLQSKIGPYVDTFLVNLVLAEIRGKAGDQEKAVAAALEKTMTKIVKHQTADGNFANNGGWAPVLSVAIANKSVVRAKQNGVEVDNKVLERAFAQSQASATGTLMATTAGTPTAETGRAVAYGGGPAGGGSGAKGKSAPAGGFGAAPGGLGGGGIGGAFAPATGAGGLGGAGFTGGVGGGGIAGGGFGDAGVSLYRIGQGGSNSQDIVNAMRFDAEKARKVIKDAKATKEDKAKAEEKLADLKKAEDANEKVQEQVAKNVRNEQFVAGFGSNGGEEFLSFLNISETLVLKGGKDWEDWDSRMVKGLEKAQDKDGSWQGSHCITGKTFCTAGALLVLMADRTPFPPEVLVKADVKRELAPAPRAAQEQK